MTRASIGRAALACARRNIAGGSAPDRPERALWLALLVLSAASCGDAAAPVPDAHIRLDRDAVQLELLDSTQLVVTATDASGNPLGMRPVTWISRDPTVASVSATGMVVGVGGGTTMVTATVEGVSASAAVTVQDWNIADNVVVIDSTRLRLVSDSAERAAGRLRFQILQPPGPVLAVGTIVVGAQSGGFLRRVTSAAAASDIITLETDPAALSDVVRIGSFSSTIDLIFAPPTSPSAATLSRSGHVRWGAGQFRYLAPGLAVTAAGFDLSGLDVCELLKAGASLGGPECPAVVSTLKIKDGLLEFQPDLDMEATFAGFSLESFRAVAKGSLVVDLTLAVELEGQLGKIDPDVTFFKFSRPFYAQIGPVPVVGYVELALEGELSLEATAKAGIEAGFSASRTVEIGAEWRNGWTPVSSASGSFTPKLPSVADGTFSGEIEVKAKVEMKPELQIIFYGVIGPFANVAPFGEAVLAFGSASCGLSVTTGVNAEVGFRIPFLDDDISDFSETWEPLVAGADATWGCPLGKVDVTTITNGQDTDPDGYQLSLDHRDKGAIGPNAQKVIDFVQAGTREVTLDGVASNCAVQNGATRSVDVTAGNAHPVQYIIDCSALTGDITVTTATSGASPDPDGYTVALDGTASMPIASNGTATFAAVATGQHSLLLSGVAPNCTVGGSNPHNVTVSAGVAASATFSIACSDAQLVVSTQTTGPAGDDSGWTVTLDGQQVRPITANGQVTFSTTPGSHTVQLNGYPSNCTATGGGVTVVQVAGGAPTQVSFQVVCEAADLTVSVSTTGDPSPVQNYTVFVLNQGSQPIGVNGTVNFTGLPAGSHSVQLGGVPAHCTVQGLNPLSVSVPGSLSFTVICETPVQCLNAPTGANVGADSVVLKANKGTHTTQVVRLDWGDLELYVTASNGSMTGDYGPDLSLTAWMEEYFFLTPIDQNRIGELVTLPVRIVGSIETSATGDSWTQGIVYDSESPKTWSRGGTGTLAIDYVADLQFRLGEWSGYFELVVNTSVLADNGNASSRVSARIDRLLDVKDANGITVPILNVCTASGTSYPM